ncbi:MAG: UPF0175 family protein [Methanosarcinaceae archaeon]|nr:UPF0175 family protein [Methanosarcinaceae archaeon]
MKTVSIRLPEQYLNEIEEARMQENINRSTMLRRLIINGLDEYRTKNAFRSYCEGKVSLWKAATMAGMTYRCALGELKKQNILFRYEKEDLDVDIQWAINKKIFADAQIYLDYIIL